MINTASSGMRQSLFGILFLLSLGGVSTGQTITFTTEQIADALLAAKEQYSTLKISYSSDFPGLETNNGRAIQNPKIRKVTLGTYAQQLSNNRVYIDRSGYIENTVTNSRTTVAGELASCDGALTVTLDRNISPQDSRQQMRAAIYGGKVDRAFKSLNTPEDFAWGYGQPYGVLVKECCDNKTAQLSITQLDGMDVVRVSGKVFGGKAGMTLWISPERGFLPIRARFTNDADHRVMIDYRVKDTMSVGEGLYYPKNIEFVDNDGKPWATFVIKEASIKDIPQAFFRPSLPANTHVTDNVMRISYVTKENQNIFDASVQRQTEESLKNLDTLQDVKLAEKDIESYVKTATGKVEGMSTRENVDSRNGTRNGKQLHTTLVAWAVVGIVLITAMGIMVLRKRGVAK